MKVLVHDAGTGTKSDSSVLLKVCKGRHPHHACLTDLLSVRYSNDLIGVDNFRDVSEPWMWKTDRQGSSHIYVKGRYDRLS